MNDPMTRQPPAVGSKTSLPDGPYVTVTDVTEGVEYGEPVWYVTGTSSLGTTTTRWIRK